MNYYKNDNEFGVWLQFDPQGTTMLVEPGATAMLTDEQVQGVSDQMGEARMELLTKVGRSRDAKAPTVEPEKPKTVNQLKAALKAVGVQFSAKAKREELEQLLAAGPQGEPIVSEKPAEE